MKRLVMHSPDGAIIEVASYSVEQQSDMESRKGANSVIVWEGETPDVLAHWIDSGAVALRQAMPAPTVTTSTGQAVLTGLPDPVEVSCEGAQETAIGGTITIDFDVPGDYVIRLRRAPQYLDHELTVTVP